jgi:hypothetical protein
VDSPAAMPPPGRPPRVAICMTTHNRIDCARINQEIIKYNFPPEWKIVHACSNAGYERYLEDELIRCEPLPLTAGALNLLQQSLRRAIELYQPEYLVHLEGDTWILDSEVVLRYARQLEQNPSALIAASSWSVDKLLLWQWRWQVEHSLLSAFKYRLARGLRPLGYNYGLRETETLSTQFFVAKNRPELVEALLNLSPDHGFVLENGLYRTMVERFGPAAILGMPEREPLRPAHRWICEPLSLYGQHWPTLIPNPVAGTPPDPGSHYNIPGKRETLQAAGWLRSGPHMQKLLTAPDLSYYNEKASRC